MRVLYVEDDHAMARTVELMLKQAGHDCETTDSGQQAIDLARSEAYDVILLDIMLPDIDGYEVIQQVRDSGVATPFLIQSGLVDRDRLPDGVSFGASHFLVKPFSKGELVKKIDETVKEAKAKAVPEAPAFRAAPGAIGGAVGGAVEGAVPEAVEEPEPEDTPSERRLHRRFRTLKSARIVCDDPVDCVIVNLSYSGAALKLLQAKGLPRQFILTLNSGPVRRCRLCWRHGDKIGVKFI